MRRRRRDLIPIGRLRPGELGLSRKRSRELALADAWRRVAGETVARRARPVAVRRGVLEIRAADARWAATLREWIPVLAGRLSRACPELEIRRVRIRTADAGPTPPSHPLVDDEPATAGEATLDGGPEPPPRARPDASADEADGSLEVRLARVRDRYLRHAADARREGADQKT